MSAPLEVAISATDRYLANEEIRTWPKETKDVLLHSYTPWSDMQDEDLESESIVKYYTDLMFQKGSSRELQEKQR